jgi:anti-sigma factor RsiW
MNCQEVLGKHLPNYLDQDLLGEVCRQIEEHLAQCPHCRVEVSTLKKTIELYHQIPSKDVPGTVEERLFKVLDLDPRR